MGRWDMVIDFENYCGDLSIDEEYQLSRLLMKALGLPEYQYTLRDMKSGTMFVGYSTELSLNHATIFAEVVGNWLVKHGVKVEGTVWQTDGGSEFIGSFNAKNKSAFIKKIETLGINHFQIPKVT